MHQTLALEQLEEIHKLKGNMRLAAEGWKNRFQTLVSIILSARTLDETTIKVCGKLFNKYPSARALSKATIESIQKLIRPVNFYINKSKSLLNCAREVEEKYHGEPPEVFEKLVALAGVGPKTANVFLAEYGADTIGVDTHVAYISHYLGWTMSKNPDMIEENLRKLFPKKEWRKLNRTLVSFGKKYTSRKEKNTLLDSIKKN